MTKPRRSRIRSPYDEPLAWLAALTSCTLWVNDTPWTITTHVAETQSEGFDLPSLVALVLSWAIWQSPPSIVAACSVGILRGSGRAALVAPVAAFVNLIGLAFLAVMHDSWKDPGLLLGILLLATQLPVAIRFRPAPVTEGFPAPGTARGPDDSTPSSA